MALIISISIIQLLGTVFLIFSKSYFGKKGENQATKEDIGRITTIIEGIKKELIDNTEELKSDLVLKNEHIISLRILERDSLITINVYEDLKVI